MPLLIAFAGVSAVALAALGYASDKTKDLGLVLIGGFIVYKVLK